MPFPSDEQLNQEKSFLIINQSSIHKLIERSHNQIKMSAKIPDKKIAQLKKAAHQIKKGLSLLKITAPPKNWQERQNLNEIIEKLNSQIAHIQTIPLSKTPSTKLELSYITRLTEQYVLHYENFLKFITILDLNARSATTPENDSKNKIFSLPENIHLFASLETLQAQYNSLSSLPDGLFKLEKLKILTLEGNCLKSLSARIKKLKSLEELKLERNKLTALPNEIGKLTKLRSLGLDSNHLLGLPDTIGRLRQLRNLGLNSNFIFEMPDLKELVQLKKLGVKNNLLTQYPSLPAQSQVTVDISKNAIAKKAPKLSGSNKQSIR